jgi:hypothetical protein
VRSKCPEGYPRNLTRKKCEEQRPESILDAPFVSSKNGSIIYKNRHCAACFGEIDTISWKIEIDWFCMKHSFLTDGFEMSMNQTYLAQILLTRCTLSFKRPKITSWKSTVCFESIQVVSSCENADTSGFQGTHAAYRELSVKCETDRSKLFHVLLYPP